MKRLFRILRFSIPASACSIFACILIKLSSHTLRMYHPFHLFFTIPTTVFVLLIPTVCASVIYGRRGLLPKSNMAPARALHAKILRFGRPAHLTRSILLALSPLIIYFTGSAFPAVSHNATAIITVLAAVAFLSARRGSLSLCVFFTGSITLVQIASNEIKKYRHSWLITHADDFSRSLAHSTKSTMGLSSFDRISDALRNSSPSTEFVVYGVLAVCFLAFFVLALSALELRPGKKGSGIFEFGVFGHRQAFTKTAALRKHLYGLQPSFMKSSTTRVLTDFSRNVSELGSRYESRTVSASSEDIATGFGVLSAVD